VEEDLTPDQTDGVTIHYATTIDDVLRVALPRSSSEQQHDSELREQVIEHATA
jgi:ATP-dependent Lon protease